MGSHQERGARSRHSESENGAEKLLPVELTFGRTHTVPPRTRSPQLRRFMP